MENLFFEPAEQRKDRLYDLMNFITETASLSVGFFENQIGYYSGSRRGERSSDAATLREDQALRREWLNNMKPLSTFLEQLSSDRGDLMIIERWKKEMGDISSELRGAEISLVSQDSKNKFMAVVGKDSEALRKLTPEEQNRPLFVLIIQVMEGAGLVSISDETGDPAEMTTSEERDKTRKIVFYPQRIIKDPKKKCGFRVKDYSGVEFKELPVQGQDQPKYILKFNFADADGNELMITDLSRIGVEVSSDSINMAINCVKDIAGS